MTNDAKFEKEMTCQFKPGMRNLTNFAPSTQKSQKFALSWAAFDQICLMALKIDAKFEGKLTCGFKNDMRNLANFHQNT